MARQIFTWQTFQVDLDPAAGEAWRSAPYQLDGHDYETIVTPVQPSRSTQLGLGKAVQPGISLGPRGGGCPCCGR
jgi:hypothetical protein